VRSGSTVRLVPTTAARGPLLIADISGYTDYVVSSPLEYAEDVLADVTRGVVKHLESVFHVNKLEGDAAFGYALDGELDASMLLDSIEECYFGFRRRLAGIEHSTSCSCNACAKAPELNLKFVVHHGDFIRRSGDRGEELTGHDVILVHRLLKNRAAKALGLRGYALCTEACVKALGIDPVALEMKSHLERCEDVGEVAVWVVDLEARWEEERERRRIFVTPEEATFAVDVTLPVPPSLAWDYLTSPQKRLLWQVDEIEEVDAGGRRCTGTSSVCVDGRTKIYEEILDWRPFDYFTERTSLSNGVSVVLTTALEGNDEGTRIVSRGRPDRSRRLPWRNGESRFKRRLHARYGRLVAIMPAQISKDRRLPLLASVPPSGQSQVSARANR
jgi:hypothetical protein